MRRRFTESEKIALVSKYLNQNLDPSNFAKTNDINIDTFRDWLVNYRSLGMNAFSRTGNQHYSEEFKLKVVHEYLNREGSLRYLCEKHKIRSKTQLRSWIAKYNNHEKLRSYSGGTGRIMVKGRKTTFEERIDIVKDYIESGSSYEEIAEKYNISYQQIYQWVRKYQEHGIDGLQDRRGKRKNSDEMTEIEKLRAELKMERAKVKHLELENRVLKKLKEIERRRY